MLKKTLRALYHAFPLSHPFKVKLRKFFTSLITFPKRKLYGKAKLLTPFVSLTHNAAAYDSFSIIPENSHKKEPLVSIIVLTYNNITLTQACLKSIEENTDYENIEIIVVDNASTDGTADFLKTWTSNSKLKTQYKIILNPSNLGFAAGNNVGLKAARGDYLVLLNNDTRVTPGWIRTMVNHFRCHPTLGLLGPVTNNIGNEAKVFTTYKNPDDMLPEVSKIVLKNMGKLTPLKTVAFFCVMIPREIFQKVGLLDETFGVGFFEDDDYCRRVEQAGYTIFCAEDVFVHHHLSASFDKMKNEARQQLFEKNKALYEAKWGRWEPHRYR